MHMNDSIVLNASAGFVELDESDLANVNGGLLPALVFTWAIGTSLINKIETNPESYTWMMDWYYD
ncbi:hypothetical protein MASR2M8_02190 [Opitutaceae bacterium]